MSITPWTFNGESAGVGSDGQVVLVEGTAFVVGGATGDIRKQGPQGLFLLDTRVLSTWVLTLDGGAVEPLTVVHNGPFSASFVGRYRFDERPDAPLAVVRRRHLGRGMRDDLEIRNYGSAPVELHVVLEVDADFARLFDVKAGWDLKTSPAPVDINEDTWVLRAPEDSVVSGTVIRFAEPPQDLGMGVMGWLVELAPGARWSLCTEVGVLLGEERVNPSHPCGEPIETAIPVTRLRNWRSAVPDVNAGDPSLVQATRRSSEDLGALRIFDPNHADRVVVAAGAPWFMALFGRDSIITAWMALLVDHDLAKGVLATLADSQGREVDPVTEEQPGRILHEVRFDPAAARWLGGRNIYYGSIDATLLFVMLAGELLRWTGDVDAVSDLIPAIDRAIEWIDEYGDRDGDGFVEYQRSHPDSLVNQGWKDSWDGVRFGDGTVAQTPIALCEVQAYAYAAYLARADIAEAMGQPAVAERCRQRAARLRERFDEAFWLPDRGFYAVGLDADKRPIDSLTSNIGHCLWSGIVPPERAPRLAELLCGPDMHTGWGLRTLSARNGGYNPLSYHCGSVWPHDTAIAVAGLARYGQLEAAATLARSLLDASAHSGGRLPELFAGFERDDLGAPVPYPASCSPQAWAAASPLLLVRSMLGLEPDVPNGVVRMAPHLPEGVDWLEVTGVPLGDSRLTIRVEGGTVDVSGLPDGVVLTAA